MGQFYKATCIDRMENVCPNDFNEGCKLIEHSYIGTFFTDCVMKLLAPNGQWHKTRICWAGDYMDDGLFLPKDTPKEINLHTYEKNITLNKKDIKLGRMGQFLVNYTKGIYLNLSNQILKDEENLTIHPLPLLTSSGNSRGFGDYQGNYMNIVGCWAGDVISVETGKSLSEQIEFSHGTGLVLVDPINFVQGSRSDFLGKNVWGKMSPGELEKIRITKENNFRKFICKKRLGVESRLC